MHRAHRFNTNHIDPDLARGNPSKSANRRSGFLLCCIALVAGCAGSHANEPPAATAASEPGVHDNDATKFSTAEGPTVTTDTPVPAPAAPGAPAAPAMPNPTPPPTATTSAAAPTSSTAPATPATPAAPVARSEPGAAADNTGRNERDRDDRQPTPMDQGNSESDIKITAAIRKAVIDEDGLSFNAKNVKIITNGGRVVLRGPVKSAAEKSVIESHAARVAGAGRVTSQLEVAK